jgi:hypothetical protein
MPRGLICSCIGRGSIRQPLRAAQHMLGVFTEFECAMMQRVMSSSVNAFWRYRHSRSSKFIAAGAVLCCRMAVNKDDQPSIFSGRVDGFRSIPSCETCRQGRRRQRQKKPGPHTGTATRAATPDFDFASYYRLSRDFRLLSRYFLLSCLALNGQYRCAPEMHSGQPV